jgi:hypothetical protein
LYEFTGGEGAVVLMFNTALTAFVIFKASNASTSFFFRNQYVLVNAVLLSCPTTAVGVNPLLTGTLSVKPDFVALLTL